MFFVDDAGMILYFYIYRNTRVNESTAVAITDLARPGHFRSLSQNDLDVGCARALTAATVGSRLLKEAQ